MKNEIFIYGIDIIVTIAILYFMAGNWIRTLSYKKYKEYFFIAEILSTISYAILLTMLWITTWTGMQQIYFALLFITAFIFLFVSSIIRVKALNRMELDIKKAIAERKRINELKDKVKIVERGLNEKKNEKTSTSTSKRKSKSSRNKQTAKNKRHLHR